MICRYCGLETGAGASHCSQAECIAALNAEIERAKRLIDQGREPVGVRREPREDGQARREGAYIQPA